MIDLTTQDLDDAILEIDDRPWHHEWLPFAHRGKHDASVMDESWVYEDVTPDPAVCDQIGVPHGTRFDLAVFDLVEGEIAFGSTRHYQDDYTGEYDFTFTVEHALVFRKARWDTITPEESRFRDW